MEKPTWLDTRFVEKVLRKDEKNESITVFDISIEPATAKGNNFSSNIHRVIVNFSRFRNGYAIKETKSVITKVELENCAWKSLITNGGLFEREMSIMLDILPTMNEMLTKFGRTSLAAQCLQVQYQNPMYLIIEDLAPRGFRLAERRMGLDLDHCLIAIQNIAAFHAASVALAEKVPHALKKYKKNMRNADALPLFIEFVNKRARAVAEEAANWDELNPRITKKLSDLSEFVWKKGCEAALFLKDDFNVLNHGELIFDNMLFRYNGEEKPIEHIFVDFQMCHYGSPATDILGIIGSSSSVDVRLYNRELLIREYHDTLSSIMRKLKCSTEIPSFEMLQDVLKKRAFYEVVLTLTALPRALIDRSTIINVADNEAVKSNKKHEIPTQVGEIYRKIMTKALPFYDSMGLLDV